MSQPSWLPYEANPRPFRTAYLKIWKKYVVFAGYLDPHMVPESDEAFDKAYAAMEAQILPSGPYVADIIEVWHGDKVVRQGQKPHVKRAA